MSTDQAANVLRTGLLAAGQALVVNRIADAQPNDAPALLVALDQYELRCMALIHAAGLDEHPAADAWSATVNSLARSHSMNQIQAELIWIQRARTLLSRS